MGDVKIKFEDASLLNALSEMAREHEHTLEAEIQRLLKQAVERRAARMAFLERAREITAMTPAGVPQSDSTLLIREDRDR